MLLGCFTTYINSWSLEICTRTSLFNPLRGTQSQTWPRYRNVNLKDMRIATYAPTLRESVTLQKRISVGPLHLWLRSVVIYVPLCADQKSFVVDSPKFAHVHPTHLMMAERVSKLLTRISRTGNIKRCKSVPTHTQNTKRQWETHFQIVKWWNCPTRQSCDVPRNTRIIK